MRCLMLTVAYRGTDFCGWQIQDGQPSIQQCLEQAFEKITGEQVRITGSGRTDSGVHALGQVASLQTGSEMDCARLVRGLNATTPGDISVLDVRDMPLDFHAIQSAKRKMYRYQMQHGRVRNPIERDFCWFVPARLDVEAMQEACRKIEGEHDFLCFQAAGAATRSSIRKIFHCGLTEIHGSGFDKLVFEIEGNGFLYNMVRNIVGSLVVIGKNKRPASWINELIASRDRSLAGETAPPQGLFLVKVDYGLRGATGNSPL